jgi:hypothetical protein
MIGVAMALNGCAECLKKQREIDRLTEVLQRLKQKLRYQERQATEGFFGSAPPSTKRPVKANTTPAKEPKRKGARPGHRAGRPFFPWAIILALPLVHHHRMDRVGLKVLTLVLAPVLRRALLVIGSQAW